MNNQTPAIAPFTAIVLCNDAYTGEPALDNDLWHGADETSRSAYFEGWAFCWSPKTARISAMNENGNGAYAQRSGEWTAI